MPASSCPQTRTLLVRFWVRGLPTRRSFPGGRRCRKGVRPVAKDGRVIVRQRLHAPLPSGLMFHKAEKLAINKSSDGRSAVVLWPSFRPMLQGYSLSTLRCGALLLCGKGNRCCVSGGSMAIGDLTEARLDGDRFAESILGHPAELWTPSLAPSGAPVSGDDLLRQDALGPVTREEDAFEFL